MANIAKTGQGKPRIALMGEFSAGKSTLSNLLLGVRSLPEQVTATRLAPVWISYGNAAPFRVDLSGAATPVSPTGLGDVPLADTRMIRLFLECDILKRCDLIDFPGISDPNMPAEVWERLLPEVDAVIWCTHATQAWRQSEAAVWDTIPDAIRRFSVLLITRYDKLINDKDRRRILQRIGRETDGQFAAIFPVSLVQALQAGPDPDKFDASGAGPFVRHLNTMIEMLAQFTARNARPLDNIADDTAITDLLRAPITPRRMRRPDADDDQDGPMRVLS